MSKGLSFQILLIAITAFTNLPSFLCAQSNDSLNPKIDQQYYLLGTLDGKIYYKKGVIKKIDHKKFINLKNSPLVNVENPNSQLLYDVSSYYNGYLESALKLRSLKQKRTVRTVIGYLIPFVGIIAGPVLGSRALEATPKQPLLDDNVLPQDSLFRSRIYNSQGRADAITYFRCGKIKELSQIDLINSKSSNLFNKRNPNNNLLLANEDYYNGFLESSKLVKIQRKKRFIKFVLIPTGIFILSFTLAETIAF